MPSIIEELPIKIVNVTVKGIKFCRQKLKDYQFNLQEKKREREWNIFLSQTKDWLIMLVKEQIKHDQFTYTLQPVFEEQEVIQSDGKKSVQMVHVANEIVPECVVNTKGGDFKVGCIVFGFNIFGELDSDVLLKIKEKWIHYLQKNGQYPLHGIAETYKKNQLRQLVFVIYEKANEQTVKSTLFQLKHPELQTN
ncbi:hypothetical protein [Streptococcus suis]|uniref:hypothetical protein n=1 Tax=Streptococcus suis TaxID=1307 RepID=UPI00041EF60C|nr:hypothetical protein [Streptococcus suis]